MNKQRPESSSGMGLKEVYFVIFRHKWRIILLSAAGLLAAAAYYLRYPTPYQSEAELFIRYVLDTRNPGPAANTSQTSAGAYGENIIVNEFHILTSFDIYEKVATNIGPEKILARFGGGSDPVRAAGILKEHLTVDTPNNSSIIHLVFRHPDPAIVQPVLREIISAYLEKHLAVHQSAGTSDDFLTEQTDQLHSQIVETEAELFAIKTNAGIISVAEAEKSYDDQISRIRSELLQARTDLAEAGGLPHPVVTNSLATMENAPPADQLDRYRKICSRLNRLQDQENEYLNQDNYTEQNPLVKEVTAQIAAATQIKVGLEKKYSALTDLQTPPSTPSPQPSLVAGRTESPGELRAKIQVLEQQLNQVMAQVASVNRAESSILDLQQKKEIEEGNYKYFSTSLEQARIDEALGPGRVSNISPIQTPTPPYKDQLKHLKAMMMMIAGGIFGGLAWAFLIEFYFDTSVKHSSEIESKLKLTLFLTIPNVRKNGHRLNGASQKKLPEPKNGALVPAHNQSDLIAWEPANCLNPFYDALRDRLIGYFESIGLTRKPKLVAVTGTDSGSGVSTIATGLAASLSETGDGRVLLVDMNQAGGSARQFFGGEPGCLLDDALVREKREGAMVQENLYVVTEGSNNEKLRRALPKRFASLVPKLKASDYDYIILDMPPVRQTSVTARLAGLMDFTLLVIESEKTDREAVQQAASLLELSKASVGAVLNKNRKYVPLRLQKAPLGDT